ncbi:MAG TPA: ArsA family ATPase [Myxococcota bacterium]
MRLVLYTGKGGVGKTTTAAAAAVGAARLGRRTLVVSADTAHSLGDVFEHRLGPEPSEIEPGLDALEIDARVETRRYWGRIQEFLVALFLHQGIEPVVAEELAMLPGAEEITTLLAVERYASGGEYDFIVLDCAPTDSTLRLATLPDVAHGMVRIALPVFQALSGVAVPIARKLISVPLPAAGVFGDIEDLLYRKLTALNRRITDETTSVRIVLTPERMVIDEARRAFRELMLFGIACDAVVMNRMLPREAEGEAFFAGWMQTQEERRREVEALFAPLPVLTAPLQPDEVSGLERLAQLCQSTFAQVEPHAVLCQAPRVHFERDGDAYLAVLPLPGARPEELDVAKIDDDLIVTTASRRRSLKLPRRIASLGLSSAKLEGDQLRVRFACTADTAAEVG